MFLSSLKSRARLLLLLFAVGGITWLAQLDYSQKISTDVLDLIPTDEQAPELTMVRSLASEQQSRVALFALTWPQNVDQAQRELGANKFATVLAASDALAEVVPMSEEDASQEELGRYAYEHRFELLLPDWLAERETEYGETNQSKTWSEWLAEKTVADLEQFLTQPEAMPFQPMITTDPQLLLPALAQSTQFLSDSSPDDGSGPVLIWARASESPFKEEGQGPLFAAVDQALAETVKSVPGAELQWTAVSRFAAESRDRIKTEVTGLNLLTLIVVLGVAAVAVKRVFKALHLVPVVLGALLGAWVVTTMLFSQVHILVFVIGSLLGGVAVDYGFYLYLQPKKQDDESYAMRVRRLIKPLLASVLTTVLGFSLLLFSDLPLIRQLGVFVSAGLLSALGVALLWFAQIKNPYLETRRFIHVRPAVVAPWARGLVWTLMGLGVVIVISGGTRLEWRDDIRDLDIPAVELKANDREVRGLFGDDADRTIYFSRGDSLSHARDSLQKFLVWFQQKHPGAPAASIGLSIPTQEAWRKLPERVRALPDYVPELMSALERRGFNADSFQAFALAWNKLSREPREGSYDELAHGVLEHLTGPMALLYHDSPQGAWFATIAEGHSGISPPLDTQTVSSGQLESMNELFSRYRESALRLSALGLGLVGLSVFLIYGIRRGIPIFAVPVGSCLFAFGVLGLMGIPLNLFHLLGAFLGVCLSHDYAIFSAENAANGEAPPPSIRLSGLTTMASFGLLAMSNIPVVSALGTTVALIVIAALLIVELGPFIRGQAKPAID